MWGTRRHQVAVAALSVLLGGFLVAPAARGADHPTTPVGYWAFDGTAEDSSGHGHALTLQGGASLSGGEIVLNGVDGAATAPGPLVYDHGAFTVSTSVKLNSQQLATKSIGRLSTRCFVCVPNSLATSAMNSFPVSGLGAVGMSQV